MDALAKKFDLAPFGEAGKRFIDRPIDKVEAYLAKSMKRGRKLLSAVVFQNGKVEELHRLTEPEKPKALTEKVSDAGKAIVEGAKAAVTVAEPTLSCPVPDFERANVRATRVLREFLTPQQLADFERTQSFLVTGADSGHQYILTSRQAPAERLDKVGGRSVFDINRGLAVCVHDWTVPAAEELLGLSLFLQMPGREHHVSILPFEPLHGHLQ